MEILASYIALCQYVYSCDSQINTYLLTGDTPEWQCAVGLFVANAANLMKAIKDTLRASKLAQEIPNNLLISSPGSGKQLLNFSKGLV